jgi:hypothetical protein
LQRVLRLTKLPEVVARLIKDNAVRQDHAEQVLAELRRIR